MDREFLNHCETFLGQKQPRIIHAINNHYSKAKQNVSLLITGVLFLIGQNTFGQSELSKLINYSLEHSHQVKKSEYQIEEAKYMRREAISQGLPQIEGAASYSKMMLGKIDVPSSASSTIPAESAPMFDQLLGSLDNIYTASAGIQVTQLIYSQSYIVGLKAAKKTQELYFILKEKNDEEVIAEVANNYYQAGSLLLQLQTVEKSIKNLNELYKIAKLNYQNDLMKETDLNRLKVSITNLEVSRQSLKNGIDNQLNYLKALAGMPVDSMLTIDTSSFKNNYSKQRTVDFNVENVTAYQAMMKQDEVYAQQVKLSKAKYFPTLAAYGKLNYSSFGFSSKIDKMSNMNTIGLNLSVPIFTSGSNYAKVKQSQLKHLQLKEDIAQNKQLLTIDYGNAFSAYQTAKELLVVQKENRELAQKVYNQTLLQFEEGMASMADLLNVNSDFLQADNSYNLQVLKCSTSEVQMLKASSNLRQLMESK